MAISFFPNRGLLKNYFDIGWWGSVLAGRTEPVVVTRPDQVDLTITQRTVSSRASSRNVSFEVMN